MEPPVKALPLVKEVSFSSVNLWSCRVQVPAPTPEFSTVLTKAVVSKQKSGPKHREVTHFLHTMASFEATLNHSLKPTHEFQSATEYHVWLMLQGVIVPLMKDSAGSLTKISPLTTAAELLQRNYLTVMPILSFTGPSYDYVETVAHYFYMRFPKRTERIRNLFHSELIQDMAQWIQEMKSIFTSDEGHSVTHTTFAATRNDCQLAWIVPPPHALDPKTVQMLLENPAMAAGFHSSMFVIDASKPTKCYQCETPRCYAFAYKHCACKLTFPSCFTCALREWHQQYHSGSVTPTSHYDITLATCGVCRQSWSIYALLHVQGASLNQSGLTLGNFPGWSEGKDAVNKL